MPYGSTMRRRISGGSPSIATPQGRGASYSPSQSSVWRHQNIRAAPNAGSANALTTNNYFAVTMLLNQMSAVNGNTPTDFDVLPSPDFSNHYIGNQLFNGSICEDYSSVIRLKNNDAVVRYLDLYESTLSFLDATNWVSVMTTAQCPVNQNLVITNSQVGNAVLATPTSGLIDAQNYKTFLTTQHYMRKIGTIELGASDSGDNTVTLNYDSVPAKCRRGNYGMAWYLFFHNDFVKNGTATLNISFNEETTFTEIPSDFRIPFKR